LCARTATVRRVDARARCAYLGIAADFSAGPGAAGFAVPLPVAGAAGDAGKGPVCGTPASGAGTGGALPSAGAGAGATVVLIRPPPWEARMLLDE
jgi:hypothetical protein